MPEGRSALRRFTSRGGERRRPASGRLEGDQRQAVADRRHENNQQYATFSIDDHLFGIEVVKVQEVLTAQTMTHVPLVSTMIGGLINLRGQIVTAIDLRARLGFPVRKDASHQMNVVVRSSDGAVSLLVDRIGDVIEVRPDLFESPPDRLDARLKELTLGVYKLKDRLLLILDTDKTAVVHA
ncbi:MAG TPA: chemotaxis protein CheW [Nitrospiria bacterium]|nr:chemotaxis protein CheW [Nitrospiria bacterium]